MGIDDYEIEKVLAAILLIGLIIAGTVVGLWYVDTTKAAPYKERCEENPRLRYANNCSSYSECVDKCTTVLRAQKS